MGVLASLLAVGVPEFIRLHPAWRLNGATREVLGELHWARAKAVEQNHQFVVLFPTSCTDASSTSLTILDDKNNNGTADTGETSWTRNLEADYPGVTLCGTNNPSFAPRWTAGGRAIITLTNSNGSRTVTVSFTGGFTTS